MSEIEIVAKPIAPPTVLESLTIAAAPSYSAADLSEPNPVPLIENITPEKNVTVEKLSSTLVNDEHYNASFSFPNEEVEADQDLGNLKLKQRSRKLLTNTPAPSTKPPEVQTPLQTPSLQTPPAQSTPVPKDEIEAEDLGTLQVRPIDLPPDENEDDLGIFKGRPIAKPQPKPPRAKWLYLNGRLDYFNSGNVFAASDSLQDGLVRTGATLSAIPALGPKTYFLGGIDGNIVRYGKFGKSPDALNYDELRFRAGILQQLSPRMYGEIGWTNQKLFTAKDGLRNILTGDRFLNENSIRLELSRTDPLSPRLSLGTYYQLRWSTSNRSENDRWANTFFTALTYKLSPSWNTGLDYFVSWSHYTNVNRDDVYQQVQVRTSYSVNRNLQMNLFGGYSFGGSTDDRRVFGRAPGPGLNPNSQLQYDAWFFGVNLIVSTHLF